MTGSVLLLGESNVGKSHFGGQLLGRLIQERGALRMVGAPKSLSAFEGVLASLHDGRAAPHTSASHYLESHWPIANEAGRAIELIWPDYGGEQVRAIRADRRMSPEWRKRVESSDGWILMIRIHNTHISDDVFSRPLARIGPDPAPSNEFTMSDQARIVDFLQWLMFVRGTGTLAPVSDPRLLLLLSCWDELPQAELDQPPADVLRQRMPMVASFVEVNWAPAALRILGLSALERNLTEDSQDDEYVDRGPENFGYVVLPNGQRSSDLTLSIEPLV